MQNETHTQQEAEREARELGNRAADVVNKFVSAGYRVTSTSKALLRDGIAIHVVDPDGNKAAVVVE